MAGIVKMVDGKVDGIASIIQSAENFRQLNIFVPLPPAAQHRTGSTPPLPASSRALWQPHATRMDLADVLSASRFKCSLSVRFALVLVLLCVSGRVRKYENGPWPKWILQL